MYVKVRVLFGWQRDCFRAERHPHLPGGIHEPLEGLCRAWLLWQGAQSCPLGGGGARLALGVLAEQQAHIDGQHVCHAGRQQGMQPTKLDHVIAQLEQIAAVPLPNGAYLHLQRALLLLQGRE